MLTGAGRFNTYLLLLALLSSGCKTAEERRNDKSVATFRLHLETDQASAGSAGVIEIAGAQLSVSNVPFLDETSVTNAAVVATRDGGFAMQTQYDRHGTLVLDSVTTAYRGRHIAIFTQFGSGKLEQKRWLGAPYIGSSITRGVLLFTPNATREEAEEVVRGLNNVAKRFKKKNAP